jgi:hypothetical protein
MWNSEQLWGALAWRDPHWASKAVIANNNLGAAKCSYPRPYPHSFGQQRRRMARHGRDSALQVPKIDVC